MVRVQRTLNPLHFEDLEPHRFEDLVRQLAYGFRTWRHLDATGRLGRDGGLDIKGVEIVTAPRAFDMEEFSDEPDEELPEVLERRWSIQCKRYREIGPKLMREVVAETIPDGSEAPDGLIIAAACDVSAESMAAFREEAANRGVREAHLWTKAHLEDMLFLPEHDHLLFAYFDISSGIRRESRLQRVRREITLKRKLLRAFGGKRIEERLYHNVLIRDIVDSTYPYYDNIPGFFDMEAPPWHVATVSQFHGRSLLLCRYRFPGWVKEEGTWDILENTRSIEGSVLSTDRTYWNPAVKRLYDQESEQRLWEQVPEKERRQIGLYSILHYDQILEIDPVGDQLHPGTHIYCRFDSPTGPYHPKTLCLTIGQWAYEVQPLEVEKKADLFADLSAQAES